MAACVHDGRFSLLGVRILGQSMINRACIKPHETDFDCQTDLYLCLSPGDRAKDEIEDVESTDSIAHCHVMVELVLGLHPVAKSEQFVKAKSDRTAADVVFLLHMKAVAEKAAKTQPSLAGPEKCHIVVAA